MDMLALSIALGTGAVVGMAKNAWDNRDIKKLKNDWRQILSKCKIDGVKYSEKIGNGNTKIVTFPIFNIKRTDYGYSASSKKVKALEYKALVSAKEALEDGLQAMVIMDTSRYTEYINIKIIKKKPEFNYRPVRVSSYNKILIAYKPDGEAYFMDLNKDCHLLIGGATGAGKSFILALILANICYNNKKGDHYDIYLSQIQKGEIGAFAKCKGVKFVGYSIDEVAKQLKKVSEVINKRSMMFTENGIKNIDQWNEFYPDKFLKRIIFVIEELSFFMPQEGDDEETSVYKKICWTSILSLVKAGRSAGIHFTSVTQRSTVGNLPSDVKSQMSRITLKQKSAIDSNNIINTSDATRLEFLELIFDGAEYKELISPRLKEDFSDLQEHVKEVIVPKKQKNESSATSKRTNVLSIEETDRLREKREILTPSEYWENIKKKEGVVQVENKKKININLTDRDREVLKFIDTYGSITSKQASEIFEWTKQNASHRLKELEEAGKFVSYFNKREKVYTFEKEYSEHDLFIVEFCTKLMKSGYEIEKYHKGGSLLEYKLRPDAIIDVKYKGKVFKIYLEIDLNHFTDTEKFKLYEKAIKNEQAVIAVIKDGQLEGSYNPSALKVFQDDFKFKKITKLDNLIK